MDKVLLVAHQYWPTPGAATQRLTALVANLRESGAEVDVITTSLASTLEHVDTGPNGERIHHVGGHETGGSGPRRIYTLLSFAIGVIRRGRSLEYTIVVSDPPPTAALAAVVLARRVDVPFVYYMADSWAGASANSRLRMVRVLHPLIKKLEYAAVRAARRVLAVTIRMRDIALAAGAVDIDVIPNGVPTMVFTQDGDRWFPSELGRPFFVYAGNAGTIHGAEVFAQAADLLWAEGEDFDLVYMGYGGDLPLIEAVQGSWPDRLMMLPNQSPQTVAAALRSAVGALSSLRPFDAYSDARLIKTLTGLACGAPAVYAGAGALADELIREGLGYVTPWSVDGACHSMREALSRHRTRPEEETALRAHCARYASEHFDDRVGARTAAATILAINR